MHFIFEDRTITHTTSGEANVRSLSIKSSDVFVRGEDGQPGDYLGTLRNLRPEPANEDVRDYRFFDAHGHQGTTTFKLGNLFEKTSLDRAKALLEDALYHCDSLPHAGGYGIVKVILEGVDPRVPCYLDLDTDYHAWSVSTAPKLIPMKKLGNIKEVFYDVRQQESWHDIKDLVVCPVSERLFSI